MLQKHRARITRSGLWSRARSRTNWAILDVLLLGPQVRHILRRVTKLVGDQAVVDVIDGPSYGRCDGAAVLKQAEDLYAGK